VTKWWQRVTKDDKNSDKWLLYSDTTVSPVKNQIKMKWVTLHLGSKPTPPPSPPKAKNVSEPKDNEDIAEERFGNASLEEAVTDDNDDAV